MPLRWDIFCRVVDNFGDIGVCWRLARQLAAGGEAVRLVTDDASALAWMAPAGAAGVTVLPWPGPEDAADLAAADVADVADVVIEAFGCDPPAAYVQAMAARDPVWINLEYLSAEGYVERSHSLPSPRADGLRKWFFYPGFTARTGGLLREPGLMAARAAFERDAWLAQQGHARRAGEQVVSLFGYDNAMIAPLLHALAAAQPTLLLLAPGPAQQQVQAMQATLPSGLRLAQLPWLAQPQFDRLLWSCELNCVRGEDSLVRALWAGAPFLWQAYPQQDGAHAAKVQALLDVLALPADARSACEAWNGLRPWPGLPAPGPWQAASLAAREALWAQPDLVTQLRRFVAARLDRQGAGRL